MLLSLRALALGFVVVTASCGRSYHVREADYRAPRTVQVGSESVQVVPAQRMDLRPTFVRLDTIGDPGVFDPSTGWRRIGARIGTGYVVAGGCVIGSGLLLVAVSSLVADEPYVGDSLSRAYLTIGLLQVGLGVVFFAIGFGRPEPEVEVAAAPIG